MENLERKQLNLEIKAVSDSGVISGYASVKNNVDLGGDVIVDGAYKGLDELVNIGWVANSHEWDDLPIAMVTKAVEDEHGLCFEAKFHSHQAAADALTVIRERMAAGKQVSLSIGYVVVDCAWETRDGKDVRVLKAINVFEISFVTLGMNPTARVTTVKGAGRPLADHVQALQADALDLASRFAAIKTDRGERFSQAYKDAARAIVEAFSPFIGDDETAKSADVVPDEDLAEIVKVAKTIAGVA